MARFEMQIKWSVPPNSSTKQYESSHLASDQAVIKTWSLAQHRLDAALVALSRIMHMISTVS